MHYDNRRRLVFDNVDDLLAWQTARIKQAIVQAEQELAGLHAAVGFRATLTGGDEPAGVAYDKAVAAGAPIPVLAEIVQDKVRELASDHIKQEWGAAERRIGKYVNLDQDTLESLVGVPPSALVEEIRSILGRK